MGVSSDPKNAILGATSFGTQRKDKYMMAYARGGELVSRARFNVARDKRVAPTRHTKLARYSSHRYPVTAIVV